MLTIQFGQCGNQLGHTLFSSVSSDILSTNTGVSSTVNYQYTEDSFNRWFNGITKEGRHLARAILVDTEQKVINKICNNSNSPWTYCTKNVVCQMGGGSANNWAYGYTIKGYELSESVLNITRQEIEKLDHFDGFLLLLGSAGGTGAGVGSHITQKLHDEYKTKTIVNIVVLPFSFGEICTQNYNTLLTLSSIYNSTDTIILFENEQVHNMCGKLLKKLNITLQDINDVISEKLISMFQPISDIRNLNSLASKISPHPVFKFATIKSTPHIPERSSEYEPIHKWQIYIHHLKQMLRMPTLHSELTNAETKLPPSIISNTSSHTYSCSVANVLVTRGTTTDKDTPGTDELYEKCLYANWNSSNWFTHFHQKRKFLNKNKFLTLLTNNSEIHHPVDEILSKAWNSYTHSAFFHQYKQFGLEENDFLRAFANLENVVKEYKELKS